MNKPTRHETVYADIRVFFTRTTYSDTVGEYTDLDITAVNPLNSNLTASERDYVVEMIMEGDRSANLNALLDALAGKGTNL